MDRLTHVPVPDGLFSTSLNERMFAMVHSSFQRHSTKLIYPVLRVFIGAVFVWASWDKILNPEGFARIIQNYQILPDMLIAPTALLLPWTEALCGVLLICGWGVKGSALIVDILLVAFILALIVSIYRGVDISCGCFSVSDHQVKSLYGLIVRDILLFAACSWVLYMRIRSEKSVATPNK